MTFMYCTYRNKETRIRTNTSCLARPIALPVSQQTSDRTPAAVERRDRHIDGRTLSRFVDPAQHIMSMGGATIGPGGDMTPHFQTQGGQGGHNLGIILISLFLSEA